METPDEEQTDEAPEIPLADEELPDDEEEEEEVPPELPEEPEPAEAEDE